MQPAGKKAILGLIFIALCFIFFASQYLQKENGPALTMVFFFL